MPVHPTIQIMLDAMKASGWPGMAAGTPTEARAFMNSRTALLGDGPEVGRVADCTIVARAHKRHGRIFLPKAPAHSLIVFFHGGGWVVGGIEDSDVMARFLVDRTGSAVLVTSYRLAPEHAFPAALEDCFDALRWADANVASLVGAKVPLIVAGDGAGGNLATLCAGLARDAGGPALALQILLYPVTDSDLDTPSYRAFGKGYVLSRADMEWFFNQYLQGTRRDDPRVAPLRAQRLAGLPPALVVTAEYDVLRDEGEAYARRLAGAGIRVNLRRYAGVTHGFLRLANALDVARRGFDDIGQAVAVAIGRGRDGGAAGQRR